VRRRPVAAPIAALLLALAIALGAGRAHASPEEDLRAARRAYERSDYRSAIDLLSPLLYPRARFSSKNQLLEAYRLLGLSYVLEKDTEQAERQFLAILSQRPDFRLDPLVDPVSAVELFEDVKKRNAEKLKAIIERERREAERRQEAERLRVEAERRRAALAKRGQLVIERTVVKRHYALNFVPFGVGQLQNGQPRKAIALLATEAALGALSLATAIAYRVKWPDGHVSHDDASLARGLAITQVTAGALFFAAVAYGIIDALVYYKPVTVTERRFERKTGFLLAPSIGLVDPAGAGTGAASGTRRALRVGLDLGLTF
jgi:hypothetical protein